MSTPLGTLETRLRAGLQQGLAPAMPALVRSSSQESCSKSRAQERTDATSLRPRKRAALHHRMLWSSTAHLHQKAPCPEALMAMSSLTTGCLSQDSTLPEPTLNPAVVLRKAAITRPKTTTSVTTILTALSRSSRCRPSPAALSRASRPQDLDTSKGLARTWGKECNIIISIKVLQLCFFRRFFNKNYKLYFVFVFRLIQLDWVFTVGTITLWDLVVCWAPRSINWWPRDKVHSCS